LAYKQISGLSFSRKPTLNSQVFAPLLLSKYVQKMHVWRYKTKKCVLSTVNAQKEINNTMCLGAISFRLDGAVVGTNFCVVSSHRQSREVLKPFFFTPALTFFGEGMFQMPN
jgi:hypothetical protein